MKPAIVAICLLALIMIACKKTNTPAKDCTGNSITERTIVDKAATIKATSGKYYLIEQGAIDSKLLPCNLDPGFAVDNLPVIVSGEVKKKTQTGNEPCCTNNFVITSIRR